MVFEGCSVAAATFNCCNSMIGPPLISAPYALSQTGQQPYMIRVMVRVRLRQASSHTPSHMRISSPCALCHHTGMAVTLAPRPRFSRGVCASFAPSLVDLAPSSWSNDYDCLTITPALQLTLALTLTLNQSIAPRALLCLGCSVGGAVQLASAW